MFEEALLDYEVSVSKESPKFEAISYIKGIYVQSRNGNRSFLTGDKLKKDKDFFLKFSPSLNCLIGGRGTGKSTLIDMLQFALSQYCDKQSKLEFMCNHANIFILYVLDNVEYIIEVSLPDVLQENKDNILQYYGQNLEDKFSYHYIYNSLSIREWTRSQYTNVYKVESGKFKSIDKNKVLDKMFDRRYSVNELVRTADGEKITEFISDLMLKNKNLPKKLKQYRSATGYDTVVKRALRFRKLTFSTVVTQQARINFLKAVKRAFSKEIVSARLKAIETAQTLKEKVKANQLGMPTFKSSRDTFQSFNWHNQGFQIINDKNPKFKVIKLMKVYFRYRYCREMSTHYKITSITFSKDFTGYYVSYGVELKKQVDLVVSSDTFDITKSIGIDLNAYNIAVSNNVDFIKESNISDVKLGHLID